jgi:sugar lactone lactonase YvrE
MAAVEPATWRASEAADFERGTLDRLSLRSDGRLTLAPVVTQILDSSLPYLWALAEDSKGNVYAGGGGPGAPGAQVHVIAPDGRSHVLATLDALEVHALAVDGKDQVYAATSPDGKVYRLREGAVPEVFFDPATKYIWALAFDSAGNLFVATGDQGIVYRVTPNGQGVAFYKTDETHARALAFDARGNLLIGTEPGGLLLRVTPSGEGFVAFQTPKREITSVAARPDGSIYLAGIGNRLPASVPPAPSAPQVTTPAPLAAAASGTVTVQVTQPAASAAAPPPTAQPAAAIAGGSEVYRIEPDGYAHRIWSHPQEIVYSLALDADGSALAGTGNRGSLYRLDSETLHTLILKTSPAQITCLMTGRGGRLYAATGNIARVLRIGPGLERQGTLESDAFDAGLFTLWGRLTYSGETNDGAVRLETRSGNLDRRRAGWSSWAAVPLDSTHGGRSVSPPARFLQWRLTLEISPGGPSPAVDAVYAAYLQRNAAPVIEEIESTPANYRFPPQSLSLSASRNITLQPIGRARRAPATAPLSDSAPVTMQYEKGQTGLRWAASDPNDDELVFKLELRGKNETDWKPLKDMVKEKRLSWDSTGFADGEYVVRVTAMDSPDNPPGQELSSQRESSPFLIDNTPPQIIGLAASRSGGRWEVRWSARDASSLVQSAEYSVDGGEWLVVQPTTRISDSPSHDYVLAIDGLAANEHIVAVRVADDYDNQSVARIVLR